MIREVYKIDENGFIVDNYLAEFYKDEVLFKVIGFTDDEIDISELITIPMPSPLLYFKPKWNTSEWLEGETDEEKAERESAQALESLKHSPSEIADAELEIKVVTMLMEMGVI